MQLAAYRIVQEALTNALNHAGRAPPSTCVRRPTPARSTSSCTTAARPTTALRAVLTVVSGSLGMKSTSPGDAGLGLAGMAERAAFYGGAVSAGPAPDGGWTVHATLKGSHS